MLVEIGDKVVSTQIFERKFVCDLNACKGACCIEGDAGAPLTLDEVDVLEDSLEAIKPYMREEGLKAVEEQGVFYMDQDNEPVTALVNEAECAFVYFDDKGITKCSVEQAYLDGKTDFKKPISCHLYPIRVKQFDDFTALNYDVWSICSDACSLGEKLGVPVFKFLKEPLIRAFGEEFFKELEVVAKEVQKMKNEK
ncbi:MAG TPA: DUF3109 family protein [Crocinitomicaceae bacterium]|nr:DUF3109 family protein [Crocinitomicaceae bacterium]